MRYDLIIFGFHHQRGGMEAVPDRGGTNEEFIAARDQYDRALRQAS